MWFIWMFTTACLYDVDYYERALLRFEDNDGDRWSEAQGDCDDTNIDINPEGDEYCNLADDDCNGLVDDNTLDTIPWYQDSDGDGYGLDAVKRLVCEQPEGFTRDNTDCNDANPASYPGATEICDDTSDLDCDGFPGNFDRDEDGFPGCAECDDNDNDAFPGGVEVCNGDDDDCDGVVDGPGAAEALPWYEDADLDGYGTGEGIVDCEPPAPSGWANLDGDCDDGVAAVNPAEVEVCANGLDDDCDGGAGGCRPSGELEPDGAVVVESYGEVGGPVGDVSGDGVDDYVVMSGSANSLWVATGAIDGDNSLDVVTYYEVIAPPNVSEFGTSHLEIGDIDRDGRDEWVVIAAQPETRYVAAYVFPESPGGIDLDLAMYTHCTLLETVDSSFFYTMDAPGDISGDALPDLLVSQRSYDTRVTNGGAVRGYTSFDDDRTDLLADFNLYGETENLYLSSIIQSGDFNGDGVTDVVVGGGGYMNYTGSTFTFAGPIPEDGTDADADAMLVGHAEDAYFGYDGKSTGDASGDGLDDIWIGANGSSRQYYGAGEVFLVTDPWVSGEVTTVAVASVSGEAEEDTLGSDMMLTDDFDADGNPDLILGTDRQEQGASGGGKIYLMYGPFSGARSASTADGYIVGHYSGGNIGLSLLAADIDGDSRLDLLYGEQQTDVGGKVNILYGYDL